VRKTLSLRRYCCQQHTAFFTRPPTKKNSNKTSKSKFQIENDLEMLQLAALGVAMGNAGARLKAVADVVVGTNDEDGVAQAIEAHVLAPRRPRAAAA
jgi:hypothetical protein